ncbi:MAG: LysM peptidoglycan-binding domain-containing protein [Anaerolineales bacterium]|nr:LysM peptidoglycan-binding domain-containing protein [Anaerolineales bacterium]
MNITRGKLVAARIYEVDEEGHERGGGISVNCMFNPFEYTITKSNTYDESPRNNSDTPQGEFFKSGAQTLQLTLVFDTYETSTDVSLETNKLWKFMMTKTQEAANQNEKIEPPQVAFEWGVFKFTSYITNMTQRFTLFKNDGTPVRANVNVTFTQYTDVNDYPRQNPTSGGGPIERIWRVVAGDRLDTIAAAVYRDAGKWRLIAENNGVHNPLALRPGTHLRIPVD